jgi:hypothetical protein
MIEGRDGVERVWFGPFDARQYTEDAVFVHTTHMLLVLLYTRSERPSILYPVTLCAAAPYALFPGHASALIC